MIEYENLLEKLGMNSFSNNNNKTRSNFEKIIDPQVKKELLLIQQVQLYKDFLAEEQLLSMYRGQVSNLVNASRAKQAVGYDMAYQLAIGALKNGIRGFDLNSGIKPITYFTNKIVFELDKLYKKETSQNTIQMASNLNSYKNNIVNAESMLLPKLGRKPTNKELLDFIQKDMGYAPSLTEKEIERIKHYDTKELSGSSIIGSENAAGAESLTFEDVMHSTESIDDVLNTDVKERKTIDNIREFTNNKNERRFLMAYLGIGEFKNSKLKGLSAQASRENGLSYYSANKLLDNFRQFCVSKGMI